MPQSGLKTERMVERSHQRKSSLSRAFPVSDHFWMHPGLHISQKTIENSLPGRIIRENRFSQNWGVAAEYIKTSEI